jgi:hypothetical protein
MKTILFLIVVLASMQIAFSHNAGIDTMLQHIALEKDDNIRFDIIYRSMVLIGESNP